jgi:hypothetical protein
MVHVKIQKRDAADALMTEDGDSIGGPDCHVVQEAEAVRTAEVVRVGHDAMRSGVVSRGAHRAKRAPRLQGGGLAHLSKPPIDIGASGLGCARYDCCDLIHGQPPQQETSQWAEPGLPSPRPPHGTRYLPL